MWEIEFTRSAEATFFEMDEDTQNRLARAIDQLARTFMPRGAKKLKGHSDVFRLRVGPWRILYTPFKREKRILVTDIEKRGQAGLYD